ncbi:UdgX family uracil-DNA binding protein [Bradyrhizobium tropiciagri]|uniref:UdgX family uracil-DNA binding protein n=1 Tax=Bradyrhizobium tropiciagri TaxID=312253 RepID=UPI001BA50A21|nr:UdgX family uracil-DNA binding protein [Bradyrhizobium tropiciagri]MBR0872264.1 UdgX family uracil-DNA binding protein [Bradyrhizobium tropiciagri]
MHTITLDSATDFDGWRKAARLLALNDVQPQDVTWTVRGGEPELFAAEMDELPEATEGTFNVPAKFVELAKAVILHRNPERFALLYRLLWRLRGHHDLLNAATDADVAEINAMARAVHRDEHKMHAFVRFREIGREQKAHYVAWFEPEHHIVELAAPFFAKRFADMPWSILTPDVCAHWDGHEIAITPGVARSEAPGEDRLEETWRRYYAAIFNPARLKVKAMQTEMPQKYWRNLPEASMIKPLIESAERATSTMIANEPTEPHKPQQRQDAPMASKARKTADETTGTIEQLREEAAGCRACPLWKNATQTVFGEGPQTASIMLVGEQPGDKEDLAGKPFVGPAGLMLDRALGEAGIDRRKAYVTNAVKHFKFVPRGKIRLHQKPATPEIRACRQWYERELAAIKPDLVVALGATAAQSVLGKITPINRNRGHLIEQDGTKVLVTVHPSYLLRLPDENAKALEYQRFVDDLKIAAGWLRRSARAA